MTLVTMVAMAMTDINGVYSDYGGYGYDRNEGTVCFIIIFFFFSETKNGISELFF